MKRERKGRERKGEEEKGKRVHEEEGREEKVKGKKHAVWRKQNVNLRVQLITCSLLTS